MWTDVPLRGTLIPSTWDRDHSARIPFGRPDRRERLMRSTRSVVITRISQIALATPSESDPACSASRRQVSAPAPPPSGNVIGALKAPATAPLAPPATALAVVPGLCTWTPASTDSLGVSSEAIARAIWVVRSGRLPKNLPTRSDPFGLGG